MKVEVPENLKADVPPTKWGKILSATPVVMAVVATMLAGLSSSEMTRAQYDRSLAAQQQSKAGDQWSFFQAKRLRGALQRNTVDLLENTTEVHPFDPGPLRRRAEQLPPPARDELLALLDSAAGQQALAFLQRGEVPHRGPEPEPDPKVKAALDALENLRPDAVMAARLASVTDKVLEQTLRADRDQAEAFDAATKPVNQAVEQIDSLLSSALSSGGAEGEAAARSLRRDFTAARLRYAAMRYEVEARLNQAIANLYELQVRKNNLSAERHHARSQQFFYGMLGAQLGVIISTFAMAARKRNLLWGLAAAAGLLAIAFAVYVYLYV